ncbi:MAG: hypothetical protein JW384_00410 [Nitrosomonadaceae bacterium]|nr:hypothetical protein [Nitrosomonadaceae bacterium]
MTHTELIAQLEKFSAANKSPANKIVPTSFDANDPTLRGFPIPLDWKWTSCEQSLSSFKAVGVMMRLPLFWQLEVPLFHACKNSGAFIFVSDRGNMPLAAEAIRTAHIDCVVTDAEDAQTFSDFLVEKSALKPRSWIIVHRATVPDTALLNGLGAVGAQEVHIFPGVPALVQCEVLRSLDTPLFHVHPDLKWDAKSNTVTSCIEIPVPLQNYPLPFTIKEIRTCECGQAVVASATL